MIASIVPVHPSNVEALRAWDGADGAYWAENEAAFDAGLQRHDRPFFEAAAIGSTDRVLDIGCGNGQTTREAVRRAPHGAALGVDLSSQMIERARLRAAEQGITHVASSRRTRRSTCSTSSRSTSLSAAPVRCSSATRSPRSPTSPARCVPAAGSCC